jgi:hypothetical protein
MQRATVRTIAEHQTTVPPNILRIILDDLTAQNHSAYIAARDHPIGARHLANGVWQEQNPLRGYSTHSV